MQEVTLNSEEVNGISGALIFCDEDGLGKASLEDILDVSPETSLALDGQCAVEFFKILDNNMHKISISENMAKKILTMGVGPTVGNTVMASLKFPYWIYCELDTLADRLVEDEDDSSDDSDDEDDTQKAKEKSQKRLQDIESIINCVLKIVKGYDELEEHFIRALATFVNRKLDKTKYDMSKWYDRALYRRALPKNKFIVTFILQTLRKNNMMKRIQLFIGTLEEDIKVKMKTASAAIAPKMKVVNDKLSLNANKKSENKKIDAFEDRSNVKHDGTVKFNNKFKNNMNNNLNNINNDNINSNQSLNKEIMITRDQNQFINNDIKRNAGSNLALDRTKNINNNLNQPEKPQQISICESSMRGPKQNMNMSHVAVKTLVSERHESKKN